MTRILRSTLQAPLLAATLFAASLAWAQTQTLTVPYRGAAAQQTAQSVIEFDATSINGGATVSVANQVLAVPSSPCAGLACSTSGTTPGGDDILLTRVSGSERVQVVLTYLSSFGGTPAYCAPTIIGTKTFDFTLSGFNFGADKGYRLTSFMAPSTASCDVAYARVPSTAPSFPTLSPIAKIGRLPINIVLVLDKSGSMSGTIPGSADIRFNRLKESVEQFVKIWQVAGAPPIGTASSEGHIDDKLGLVLFDSNTTDGVLDGSFFKARGNSDSAWWGPVSTAIGNVGFGSTSIGGGISRARTKLDEVDAVSGDTATILFTDGEQNTAPCVMREQETISFGCTAATPKPGNRLVLSNAPATLLAKTVPLGPVYTIGLGEGSGAFADLLDRISNETAGRGVIANSGPAMDAGFTNALIAALKGSTMSLLARTKGSIPASSNASAPILVFIDDAVQRAVFTVRWNGLRTPQLEIRRPDGSLVTNPRLQPGNKLIVAGVDIAPGGVNTGPWQLRVVRPQDSITQSAAEFDFTAIAVEPKLRYRVTETPATGTGKPITIAAEIGWENGEGLSGLPPGSVRVRIARPGENLGNILFDSQTRGDPVTQAGDVQDPLRAKLDALNQNGNLATRIAPGEVESIAMTEVGFGRYEATFDATRVGGQYQFVVELDWNVPKTGLIKRLEVAERQVPVIPTSGATTVDVQSQPGNNAVIAVTPRDSFGNYVGPGYAHQLTVQVGGVTLPAVQVSDPLMRGIYRVSVTGVPPQQPGNSGPPVVISYGGQPIVSGSLWTLGGGSGSGSAGNRAVWLGIGSTFPSGSFSNDYKKDTAFNVGFEYGLGNNTAIEATVGMHQFKGKNASPDIDVTQFGVNGKWYFAPGAFKPFVTLGLGGYAFDPGSTRFGVNAGAGAQLDVAPRWSIEGRYTFHGVSGNSPNSRYSTLLLGLRYSF
jgi:opacity protein-like surface antigen